VPKASGGRLIEPAIIVDTRETLPYEFKGSRFQTKLRKLDTGDYSLEGHEDRVGVERKTKPDAYGVCGQSRVRFVSCLERLARMDRGVIVIESSLAEFAIPLPYETKDGRKVTGAQAVGSFISWSCQYRIPVFWCGSREAAERVTIRWLAAYLKHVAGGQHGERVPDMGSGGAEAR
jgi:ERCC4-type nuclease